MIERVPSSLSELEATIERGLATFVEVGSALLAIRDDRLYRVDYATFDDYCQQRWGMKRAYAYQLIDAAQVVSEMSAIADTLPRNEAQARELARFPREQRAEAWQEAVKRDGEKVTAATIRQIHSEEAPAYDVTDAAYQVSDDAGKANLDRLNYLAALSRTLSQVTSLLTYDPERVAEVIDPEFKRLQIDVVAERIADWTHRVEQSMPKEFRVVKGGRA